MGILDWFTRPSQHRFAWEVLRVTRRTSGVVSARYDKQSFSIAVRRAGETQEFRIFLSNIHAETAGATGAERRSRIERLVRMISAERDDGTWDTVRPNLRPVLRQVTFGNTGIAGAVPPISRPAMPFLQECVVVDHPDSMAYVTR